MPEVASRYAALAQHIFTSAPQDAPGDLPAQMAKLCSTLTSGEIGMPAEGERTGCRRDAGTCGGMNDACCYLLQSMGVWTCCLRLWSRP